MNVRAHPFRTECYAVFLYRWQRRNAPEWKSIEQRVSISCAARHLVVSALDLSVPSMKRPKRVMVPEHTLAAEWLRGLA